MDRSRKGEQPCNIRTLTIERSHGRGRQGKRPAFGSAYVVGWIGQFDGIGDMPCWRFLRFVQANQRTERRHTTARPGLWP